MYSLLHVKCNVIFLLFYSRQEKYKDANEMLNDKSEIAKYRNIYEKYSVVSDERDDYNDEYDDTYDSQNIRGSAPDDSTEIDVRSFTMPRVSPNFLFLLLFRHNT